MCIPIGSSDTDSFQSWTIKDRLPYLILSSLSDYPPQSDPILSPNRPVHAVNGERPHPSEEFLSIQMLIHFMLGEIIR